MKQEHIPKIMLVAGGTGGHLFPAIALSEELIRYKKSDLILVTDLRCSRFLPANLLIKHHVVKIYINLKGIKNIISSIWQMISSVFHSVQLIYKEKPELVIGFGGYTSFPTLIIAKILRIPIIIFEPNSFMGRVNLFFAKYAQKIITSANIVNMPQELRHKLIPSPLLIRQEIKHSKKAYNAYTDTFHLVIIGGSQGASVFDNLIPEAIEKVLLDHPNIRIKITQQVKRDNIAKLQLRYEAMNVMHNIADFFSNIADIYSSAQLVISRSGASSVSEITYMNIPAIYIPYPHAKDDHQFYNAKVSQEKNYAWCFKQDEITDEILATLLKKLITDRSQLQIMSDNMQQNSKNTNMQHLSSTVFEIIDR